MPIESQDFHDVIEKAQRVTAADVSTPFAGQAAFVNKRAGNDLEFDAHVSVFCMPTDGPDYEDVMNEILSGNAVMRYEEKTFDKEGNFLVAICYLTPRVRPAQAVNVAAGDAEPEVRPRKQA